MDSVVVQLCAVGLVLVSLGNIYQIVAKCQRVKVWVPKKLDAGVVDISTKPPFELSRRPIDVDVVEVNRNLRVPRLTAEPKNFDDLYGSSDRL